MYTEYLGNVQLYKCEDEESPGIRIGRTAWDNS